MPCFGPLNGYRPKTGKKLVFDVRKSLDGLVIKVPCGRCVGCRLERSRQWAMRCMHEKRMHNMSSFLTLTYSDEFLPVGNTLVLRDLQLFMKRLRKVTGNGLRFYACGEYGDVGRRPHYHVLLFNYDFDDRKLFKRGEFPLYTSKSLDRLWSVGEDVLGFATIGDVTFDSCAYVARYIMKKALGKHEADFARYDPVTGLVALPEFTVMSRGSKKLGTRGIGYSYYVKYGSEVYAHDSVVVNGREVRPPAFYDKQFALDDPVRMDQLKVARLQKIRPSDNTTKRLRVREVVTEAKLKMKGRSL